MVAVATSDHVALAGHRRRAAWHAAPAGRLSVDPVAAAARGATARNHRQVARASGTVLSRGDVGSAVILSRRNRGGGWLGGSGEGRPRTSRAKGRAKSFELR